MISVVDTAETLERAGSGLRADEDRLARILEAAAAESARLRAEQAALFRSLARLRLDEIAGDRVAGKLDAAERRALAALAAQRQQLDALAQRRDAHLAALSTAQAERAGKAKALGRAADALGALAEATRRRMADDLEWQAQAARLSGAQARAEAAADKAQRSQADCDEKSVPYLADRLFVYLWDRGYGTAAYRGGTIARLGDRYVARAVNYEPARLDYFSLTELPKRLREHAGRLLAEVEAEADRLAALERAALEADGIAEPEAAHRGAEAALAAADARIAGLEAEAAALEQERTALLDEDGAQGLGGALADLADALQRQDLRDLLRAALQTPTPDDERIVRRLQEIEGELARQDRDAAEARRTALDLARKRAEVERARDEFRHGGYERQGGGFSNDRLIGEVLGGILDGVLSSRELRDALRSGYRPARRRSGGARSGGSFGGSWGGGSSGGGFKTGGRF
ncbi:MAG: hypothetical protein RIB84_09610 [Sneathiellaceae bacterium]